MSKSNKVYEQTYLNCKPLTNSIIHAAPPRKSVLTISDNCLRGLYLRESPPSAKHPSGKISYRIDVWHKGKRHNKAVGDSSVLEIDEARALATDAIANLKNGKHHRLILAHETVFEAFADMFFRRYRRNWKPATYSCSRHAYQHHILPWFAGYDVCQITRDDVLKWFAALKPKPGVANRSLPLLSVMMREAERYGYRAASTNPCERIRRYRLQAKERFLSDEEYRRLGNFLQRQNFLTPDRVAMLRLLLLTGCRKGEILRLKWSEYRTGAHGKKHLFLDDSKTGPKTVYLSEPARHILNGLPRTCKWMFPTKSGARPYFDIGGWMNWRKMLGLADVRLHDLRHSYASLALRNGVDISTLGRLLGHADPETTLKYAHLSDQSLQDMVQIIGSALDNKGQGK